MKTSVVGVAAVVGVITVVSMFMINLSLNTRTGLQQATDVPGQYQQELADKGYANGKAALAMGKLDLAIASFTDALRFDPNRHQAVLARGEAYLKNKQYKKAIEDLTRYLKEHPDHRSALVSRATARCQLGQFALAIEDCDEALKQHRDARALSVRGDAWLGQMQYAKALADLDEALRLDPCHARALALRAATYLSLGQPRDAGWDLLAAVVTGAIGP